MKTPRRAIVLAAGFGTRLLPLTLLKPKPLFPVWGKPILGHTLELLRRWGVSEVLINAHHHAGQILDYVKQNPVAGLRSSVSFEPAILGTGGAVSRARWFIGDEPFWMINADVMADLPCEPLLKAYRKLDAIASLWLAPDRGPRTVEHHNGVVTNFKSATPGYGATATFCGLQLLSPRILAHLPAEGFFSIVQAYQDAMAKGEAVAGVVVPGSYWADIGQPAAYLEAHREMLRHGNWKSFQTPGTEFVACGAGVRVNRAATVSRSILWDNVRLGAGAEVENAIITEGVHVDSRVEYMAIRADQLPDPVVTRVLTKLEWSPQATTVMPLPPRGSARTFTRLVERAAGSKASSAILVRYALERPENGLYCDHARFLARHGVSVPAVLLDWPDERICVLEDVGNRGLDQLVPGSKPQAIRHWYRQTLETVARLHTAATQAVRRSSLKLSIPFTRHLYEWEQNLFIEQFLDRHLQVEPARRDAVRKELAGLIPAQLRAPRVLIHRDLQSSNVLVKEGRIFLIDFQGMRYGTAAYDLASLLCDPYVNLPGALREELLEYYLELVPADKTTRDLFWIAAVERLSQALGAFGRLGAAPATSYFLKHIPSGVAQLRTALGHLQGMPTLKACLQG